VDVVTPSTELPRRKRVVPRRDSHELHVVEGDGSDEGIYLDLRPEALEDAPDAGPGAEVLRPRFRAVAAWREAPRDITRFSDLLGMRDPRDPGGRPPEPTEPPRADHTVDHTAGPDAGDLEDPSQDPYAVPPPDGPAPGAQPTEEYTVRAEWLESTPERVQSARTPVWLPSMEYAAQAEFLDSMPDLPMSPWAPRPTTPTEEYLVRAEQLEWLPERIGLTRRPVPEYGDGDDGLDEDFETGLDPGLGVGADEESEELPQWLSPSQLPEYTTRAERIETDWLPPAEPMPEHVIRGELVPEDPAPKHLIPEPPIPERPVRDRPGRGRTVRDRPVPGRPPVGRTPEQESRRPTFHGGGETPEHSSHFPGSSLRGALPPDPPTAPRMVRGPLGDELNIFASLPDDDVHVGEEFDVHTAEEAGDDLTVPEFLVPGFGEVAPDPAVDQRLGAVLNALLGAEVWRRCLVEWGSGHCVALARLARGVDGQAPSAATSLKSTAGAGLRWLGVTRDEDALAAQIADAIVFPPRASQTVEARTVRLYGVAICTALGQSPRRCACHRDLMRDVTPETVRTWLDELAVRQV
jgi:hypothetical protein